MFTIILPVKATHIVGGDIFYDVIAEDVTSTQYKITLILYLDCENGNPAAIEQDASSILGIFNCDNDTNLFTKLEVFHEPAIKISDINYDCIEPVKDACVSENKFTYYVKLPKNNTGYLASFQRCCRNHIITNIVKPGEMGANYHIFIPGQQTVKKNNAARFKKLPPNFLCNDLRLEFDHSAIDPDGDSLVYELYQPYHGGGPQNLMIRPDPPLKPPLNKVQWKFPFNTGNMMGGKEGLKIDRHTGHLSVYPNQVGQYVVGIKVKEYRNGKFIGETLRDYQFYVRNCKELLVVSFAAPIYSCSDTVVFQNESEYAKSFKWDFGDPTKSSDSSSVRNPYYVYPGNGDYTVELYAENEVCKDQYSFEIKVRSQVEIEVGPDTIVCPDQPIEIQRTVHDPFGDAHVYWSNNWIGETATLTTQGAHIAYFEYGKCLYSDTFNIFEDSISINLQEELFICDQSPVTILANGVGVNTVEWMDDPTENKWQYTLSDSGYYWVKGQSNYCEAIDTIRVILAQKPQLLDSLFVCNEFDTTLDAGGFYKATYLWDNGSENRYRNINQTGVYWVMVRQGHCVNADTFILNNPVIPLDLGPDDHFCDSVSRVLYAPQGMKRYEWNIEGASGASYHVKKAGEYVVWVKDENNCEKEDTVRFTLSYSPEISLGNDTGICVNTQFDVEAPLGFEHYLWEDGSKKTSRVVNDSVLLSLTVTDAFGCKGKAQKRIYIDLNAGPNELFIPNAFTPNDDLVNDWFPYSTSINTAHYYLRIFNRWGEKIFETHAKEADYSWDGFYKNRPAEAGVYVYLLEYQTCSGFRETKTGSFHLIR